MFGCKLKNAVHPANFAQSKTTTNSKIEVTSLKTKYSSGYASIHSARSQTAVTKEKTACAGCRPIQLSILEMEARRTVEKKLAGTYQKSMST